MGQQSQNDQTQGQQGTESQGKNEQRPTTSEQRSGESTFKAPQTQEELDDIITRRLARARRSFEKEVREEIEETVREELRAEASQEEAKEQGKWKELYEAEQQKVADLEKKIADSEIHSLKVEMLEEKGLPASAAKRIFGETKDEIAADIEEYMKDMGPIKPPKETGSTTGSRQSTSSESKNGQKRDYSDPTLFGFRPLAKS